MRGCPKCGFVDPPEWRHLRFSYWIDFCFLDDFEASNPQLTKRLKDGEKLVKDGYYVYRLSGKGRVTVHRKALVDYGEQFRIPMEHVNPNANDTRKHWQLNPNQTRLLEVEKNE